MIVLEYHAKSLASCPRDFSHNQLIKFGHQILEALSFINSFGVVHRCLAPDNILFDAKGNVKLFNYGLYFMTGQGADVNFPIG